MAVIVVPQWNANWEGHVSLCRLLGRVGITTMRLSLPFHHHRKPAHLERAEYLISPNLGRTVAAMRQGVLDVRRATDWLLARGYERVAIMGTSVGALVGFLSFIHDERLGAAAFVHGAGHLADVVWNGLATRHVRAGMGEHVTLEELRRCWAPVSAWPFLGRLRDDARPLLLMSGRYDTTCRPEGAREVYAVLGRQGIAHEAAWLPCGHYTAARFPFNVMIGWRLLRFFRGG